MSNCLFLINHALDAKTHTIYNQEIRFNQTLETLDSINTRCINNRKIIFDSSPEHPKQEYIDELITRGVEFHYFGDIKDIKKHSLSGERSLAETKSFMILLSKLVIGSDISRIYKLSGRYRLTDDFIPMKEEFTHKFVFSHPLHSWMSEGNKRITGINKLYRLRLWHMDVSLLNLFEEELFEVLKTCLMYGVDIEHAYYKHLSKYNNIYLDKIGVEGNIAPSGEYINE